MIAQLVVLTKLVVNGNKQQVNSTMTTPQLPNSCTFCGEEHIFVYCHGNPKVVNVIGTPFRDNTFS